MSGLCFGCREFRAEPPPPEPPQPARRYYAFAQLGADSPRVMEYADDEDGVAALANLIRTEEVLAIVRGERLHVRQASVVEIIGRTGASRSHTLNVAAGD